MPSCTAPGAGSPRPRGPWMARSRIARSSWPPSAAPSRPLPIRGPIRLDEYGNPTENVYIVRVDKQGGKLVNTIIHTYPLVSQFWTYKPEEFLKNPAYSRDYPPLKP